MTPEQAWGIIKHCINDDCGPADEGWKSDELLQAIETFHRLYGAK